MENTAMTIQEALTKAKANLGQAYTCSYHGEEVTLSAEQYRDGRHRITVTPPFKGELYDFCCQLVNLALCYEEEFQREHEGYMHSCHSSFAKMPSAVVYLQLACVGRRLEKHFAQIDAPALHPSPYNW